jgi:phosphinothricin acetyltransferase
VTTATIRLAHEADAPALTRIFNEAISSGIANAETEHKDTAFMAGWLLEHDERYAVLVYEDAGNILGYASLNNYYPKRGAYRYVAELSYYVAAAAGRRGIGTELLRALLRHAASHGFHKCIARSFVTNESSRRLLQRFAFRRVGVFEEDALVNGEWRSVAAYEKLLSDAAQ